MTDVLIRNVSDQALARIDERAARQGLSRAEYLRRQIEQEAQRADVEVGDLTRLAALTADLLSEDVMSRAWS